jgi:hypothetical protein
MRPSVCAISCAPSTVITGDCDRSMRSASLTDAPSVESEVRLSNSATTTPAFASSLPEPTSVPAGPMPRFRIVAHVPAPSASALKASAPPRSAFRHVNSPATGASPLTRYMPVACATARFRSMRPVTSMIGRPMASSTAAAGVTHAGMPMARPTSHSTPSTTIAPAAYATATATGWPYQRVGIKARTGCVLVGVKASPDRRMGSSAASSSSAVWNRSAGRFSRQRMTACSSAGGMPARRAERGSGALVRWATSTCWADSPTNGGRPVSISYAIAPMA